MTELQKVLYDYAWEYQIPGLLRASQRRRRTTTAW